MHKIFSRLLLLAFASSSLFSCSVVQQDTIVPEEITLPNRHAATAGTELKKLKQSDVLIKLNNSLLADEFTSGLQQLSSQFSDFSLQNISISFEQQFIRLTSQFQTSDSEGNVISAKASGKIRLEVSGDQLEWFPTFKWLELQPDETTGITSNPAQSELSPDQQMLSRLNSELNNSLRDSNLNHISLNPVPLGEVEVGARLVTFNDATAVDTAPLNGVFFVTGSAVLITRSDTSILMDLSFVPDLSVCPADIDVSRAVFSRAIEAREPLGVASNLDNSDDMRIFYSEISGATRPMTIIHYWFADGQPVAVEELPVGPSERWRTWSTRGDMVEPATHWRVLVVEKDSGCILHSQSIRSQVSSNTEDGDISTTGPSPNGQLNPSVDNFTDYQAAFNKKAAGFPGRDSYQNKVSIDVRREYLGQVIQSAISDLNIETVFSQTDLPAKNYSADLLPFESKDIICEEQNCANPLVCTANVTHCKRVRDTRECSSCLFLNPLNNRCLQTAEDPICVAAKNRQNTIYQQEREACIAAANIRLNDCQQLSNQIAQSCEIENQVEQSACEASKTEIASLKAGSVLARVTANSSVSGQLSTQFSNFKVSADLKQLQQNVTLKSELNISGQLDFKPGNTDWLLSNCINAWSGPFKNRAISSTPLNSMLTTFNSNNDVLSATWSGVVLPLQMTSSPLESAFVSNPQLLAGCSIGLTVDKVEQAIVGQNADFFTGSLNLIIQPLPTQLRLNHAQIELARQIYTGPAQISDEFVSYKLK